MEDVQSKTPKRKAKMQKEEAVIKFIPQYAHYKIEGKQGAEVPEELAGTYTSEKLARQAINIHFKK